jgi:hypothetical protein
MHIGWDWASQSHDVTVIDDHGQVVDRWSTPHTQAGLDRAIARLAGHGRPEDLPVAIELSSGLVVERLLAAGHPVVPIHPNAFNATRPRWGAARAKSDPGDSYKLADLLRTDSHRLRRLKPLDTTTRHLQALARLRADHVHAKTAATNQLGALLDVHWPGAKQVFARLDSQIALDFLERYPTPKPPGGSVRPAWPPSCAATPTAAGAAPPSCLPACTPPHSPPAAWTPRWWPSASPRRSTCSGPCLAPWPTWTAP